MDDMELVPFVGPQGAADGEYREGRTPFGKQMTARFANGYGASVIQSVMSYGNAEGKYELAVLHGYGSGESTPRGDDAELCYATPITGDVIGWLDQSDVVGLLNRIAALPADAACNHSRPDAWDPFDASDEHTANILDVVDSLRRAALG